jgi:hypothetical protein
MSHTDKHPLAGQTVRINSVRVAVRNAKFVVGDWFDRVNETTWRETPGPAAQYVRQRKIAKDIPDDDNVVIGRVDGFEKVIHQSEIGEVVADG